jgi:hypothetical protein
MPRADCPLRRPAMQKLATPCHQAAPSLVGLPVSQSVKQRRILRTYLVSTRPSSPFFDYFPVNASAYRFNRLDLEV